MVKSLILTANNIVDDEYRNTFKYTFPTGAVNFYQGDRLALCALSCYMNWFNISDSLNNNKFTYYWFSSAYPYGDFTDQFDVTIPSGYYTTETLNEYLQYTMINNKTYLEDGSNYVYYIEMKYNTTYNRLQLVCYALPTALPSGYSYPSGATWTLPSTATAPVFEVLSDNNFGELIGFDAGQYPPSEENVDYTILGQSESKFHAGQSSLLMTCNLVDNTFSVPSTLLASIPITGLDFGDIINYNPGSFAYHKLHAGQFTELTVSFTDQDFTPIKFERDVASIHLLFRRADETD
jgi:hypothetical protein